jgi:hypothetical protein
LCHGGIFPVLSQPAASLIAFLVHMQISIPLISAHRCPPGKRRLGLLALV